MNRNSYLVKNTFLLFLGTFGTKFISFFMVPIYTHVLTQEQYGITDIAFTISMLLTPVIALNIHEAIMRFAMDKNADIAGIVTSGILLFFVGAAIFSVSIPIMRHIESLAEYAILIYSMVWATALLYIVQAYLKGTEQIKLYSFSGILITFLTALLNIIFLIPLKMGVVGYLLSTVVSYFSVSIIFIFAGKMYRHVSFKNFKLTKLSEMMQYSLALVPNSILWWAINSSNRLIIAGTLGPAANGIFAVSNKLPTLLNNITGIFQQAWQLTAIKANDARDKDAYANQIYKMYSAILWCCAAGMIWLQKVVLKYYVESRFFSAWKYTPLLVTAFVILALASYIGTYYSVAKNSKGMMLSAIAGMVVNLILNAALIPSIGLQGAAIAALGGYAAILVYRWWDTRKYIQIDVFDVRFFVSLAIVLFQTAFTLQNVQYEFGILLVGVVGMIALHAKYLFPLAKNITAKLLRRSK